MHINTYIYMHTYTCRIHIDAIIKRAKTSLKKYTSHFIWKVVCERELETEQRLQHIDLPSPSGHRHVSFSFPRAAQPGAWGPASLGHVLIPLSSHQLVSKLTAAQSGVPKAPSAGWWFSLPPLVSDYSDPQLTDFLSSPSYIIVQSPTQSLEWHVWSSSSRNNCHAVHRSHSSGASVYECTMGFYLVPYCQQSPPTRFLLITAIGMLHFLSVHHFGMACLAGSKVSIQHNL